MSKHDSRTVRWAEGKGTNFGKARNVVGTWRKFCAMLENPTKTKERRKQFDAMSKEEQDDLKSVDGWIMAAPVSGGKRTRSTIETRDLISLDYDYMTTGMLAKLEAELTPLSIYEFVAHSSRRHTPEKPRIRIYMPLKRDINKDEFASLSRIVAFIMEGKKTPMTQVDKVSFRPAQMMFKPTISLDQADDYVYLKNEGTLLDPDAILAWYRKNYGDPFDFSQIPRCEGEADLRRSAEKAEDPTEKKGPVGDFCRTWDVPAAIDYFDLPYKKADDWSEKPRYSYTKGTSTSGAVLEDGGLFLYSHHGSDPTADRLVNAFDLTRIHLFGELDEDTDKDTPPTEWPSYKRLVEYLRDIPEYRKTQRDSRYDRAAVSFTFEDSDEEDTDDAEEDDGDPIGSASPTDGKKPKSGIDLEDVIGEASFSPDEESVYTDDAESSSAPDYSGDKPRARVKFKRPKVKPDENWFDDLEANEKGTILSTANNGAMIIYNDKRLSGRIAHNAFTNQLVCVGTIKSNLTHVPDFICQDPINGDRWQDFNDITIRMMVESPPGTGKAGYGLKMTDRDMNAALHTAARRNVFHPVRLYLSACEAAFKGNADAAIETLLMRYLKVDDSPYFREVSKLMLLASVVRIFEPGHKFDYIAILEGETGLRKSTFIQALYSEQWFRELSCKLDDQKTIAEHISGMWGGEIPEMQSFAKTDHNAAKVFLRRTRDDVRMAYDRRISEFPRQTVFWATTNDNKYLRDTKGNRSYWPIRLDSDRFPKDHAGNPYIDTDLLQTERDWLWGAAMTVYRAMRKKQPTGILPLTLRNPASIAEARRYQEDARLHELHEMWLDEIVEWADTPITLAQFLTENGEIDPLAEKFSESKTASDILVLRCAFTQKQAVELALKKDRGIRDYQSGQTIGKALADLDGWAHPKAVGYEGTATRRVGGRIGRWFTRHGATGEELKNGYRVLSASAGQDSDDSDDCI